MPIIAKAGGDFKPAPQGTWPAVCVDVVDLGIVQPRNPQYKPAHRIQLRWILDAPPVDGDNKPPMVVRGFGLSLGEKSLLRPFLEAWRGRAFSEQELEGFDVETVIGVNCQLQVIHKQEGGKVYANVTGVLPLGKGMAKMKVPTDYIRQEERDRRGKLESEPDGPMPEDDDPQYAAPDDPNWTPF